MSRACSTRFRRICRSSADLLRSGDASPPRHVFAVATQLRQQGNVGRHVPKPECEVTKRRAGRTTGEGRPRAGRGPRGRGKRRGVEVARRHRQGGGLARLLAGQRASGAAPGIAVVVHRESDDCSCLASTLVYARTSAGELTACYPLLHVASLTRSEPAWNVRDVSSLTMAGVSTCGTHGAGRRRPSS